MKELFKKIITESLNSNNVKLYHGSKYLFNEFSMSKINTGQRSQDFGHGLYFTSNEETAKFYANELSNTKTALQKYNDIITNGKDNDILLQYLSENRLNSAKRIIINIIKTNPSNITEWEKLLSSLDKIERFGYIYTVDIYNPSFITKEEYILLKHKTNLNDKKYKQNFIRNWL